MKGRGEGEESLYSRVHGGCERGVRKLREKWERGVKKLLFLREKN